MPISIDEFEARDPDGGSTNAERVLRFLAHHRTSAFKARELAEETGVNPNSIHPVLHRLEARGLVRHRSPYWALGDPDALRDARLFGSTASFLDELLGPEDREAWLAAAEESEG